MTPLELALDYARHGLPVIPVRPRSKVPSVDRWTERATKDTAVIRGWFHNIPANLGVATGHPLPSDGYLVVLDIDEHDPAESGSEALRDLEDELGELPGTYTVQTPTGGRHIYLRSAEPLTNAAGSNLPAGIDVRGAGGYVLAPPSEHPDGGRYEAEVDYAVDEVAAMPAAWETRLRLSPDSPRTARTAPPAPGNVFGAGLDRPGDAWAAATTWETILTRDGWTYAGRGSDGEDQWTRPGKTTREGISATTSYGTHDVLKVFTSNASPLVAEMTYTKLGYLAEVHHSADYEAAVEALREAGYGTQAPSRPSTPAPVSYEPVDVTEAWETPISVDENYRPPFPLDALPAWIADQAHQAAEEMQLTPDLAAQLAITALAIVTAGRVEVAVTGRWREPTNVYSVTALPPSAGKSPTFSMMLGALDRWEEELVEASAKEIADRDIERKVREHDRDSAIKRGETTVAKSLSDELLELPPIKTPRLLADDATPEKLVDLLDQQGGRLALVSTEGGLFGMMTGRYSDKANLDVYLGAWSGDTIRVDRIERGTVIVRRPRLTIGLTVQPSVLADVGKNRELVGRGLTARFMYALPVDTVGNRDKRRDSSYKATVEDRYNELILGIARRLDDRHPDDGPLRLELSDAARRRFLNWTADREAELGPYSELRYMAEWVAKCDSSVARLAALLHLANGNAGPLIDEHTVADAIAIGTYWTAHARAVFDMMGASDDLGHARYLLGWLETRDVDNDAGIGLEVTFRDLHQHAKKRVEKAADLIPAVELLVERGWLRPTFEGTLAGHVGRGKPSPTFTVSPYLTVPHIPHSTAHSDGNLTHNVEVREVREVSHRHPGESSLTLRPRQDEDTAEPELTSLTSTTTTTTTPDSSPTPAPARPF